MMTPPEVGLRVRTIIDVKDHGPPIGVNDAGNKGGGPAAPDNLGIIAIAPGISRSVAIVLLSLAMISSKASTDACHSALRHGKMAI